MHVFLPCATCFSCASCLQPVGRWALDLRRVESSGSARQIKDRKHTFGKFQESAWKCFAYTCLTLASWWALRRETYWHDTHEFYTECSRIPCEYRATEAMNFAYALDMAYYTYAIPYCILFEEKREDFWATFAHHVVTVALIAYSYVLGFTKVGVVILFLHDICDPWLELAKLFRYGGVEWAANALFVVFTVTWIAMRDVYYPLWVIRSVLYDAYDMVVGAAGATRQSFPHWETLSAMLIFLWVLHVFWTYVILKIAVQAVRQGSVDDTREKRE